MADARHRLPICSWKYKCVIGAAVVAHCVTTNHFYMCIDLQIKVMLVTSPLAVFDSTMEICSSHKAITTSQLSAGKHSVSGH